MRFGIFHRLTAGYLAVLFLLGAASVYAIFKLVRLNTTIVTDYQEDIRLFDSGRRIADALFSERRSEQKFLLTGDDVFYEQFLAAKSDFERLFAELRAHSLSPDKDELFDRISISHQQYQALVQTEFDYLKQRSQYDRNLYRLEKQKVSDAILEELEGLEKGSREDFFHKAGVVSEAGASARRVAIVSFLVTVLLVVLLAFLVTRSITNPLIGLVRKTREIESGIFKCDPIGSAPPEIAELSEAFNRMCDRLREMDRLKADFFAMISHELKTPLTTISEGTSLLIEGVCGAVTEKQNRLLAIISAESSRLAHLVNSILDLSKMESGMMPYNFEKRSIAPLIEQAVNEIVPYAEAKRIRVEREIGPDIPAYPMDADRILDALRNLIGNALKFTPEGGRIVVAATAGDEGLRVSVSDSGSGIPAEKLHVIFEKYESGDAKKGTGLGLAIVKHIITAHGGEVWAESRPGVETRFTFLLPS
ncbi:MAG: HAMP domain-containing protein [Deltaproteobacteria bacterium]|nr:HAMP domain-containing protein [Deltaproteobacteria bacterium]